MALDKLIDDINELLQLEPGPGFGLTLKAEEYDAVVNDLEAMSLGERMLMRPAAIIDGVLFVHCIEVRREPAGASDL